MQKEKEIKIREAMPEDAVGVSRVHIESWQETYRGLMSDEYIENLESLEGQSRRSSWEKKLSDPELRQTIWVACSAEVIVGFVIVGKSRDEKPIADGEVYAIYLLKAYQGRGGGRLLFEKGLSLLRSRGMKSASLWVVAENSAEGFYRHLGGRSQGEKVDQCGGAKGIKQCRYVWLF